MSPRSLRPLGWALAALTVSGLAVAVGCGDDSGAAASSQGGSAAATEGSTGPSTPSATASAGGDGGAGVTTSAAVSGVATVTQGPGPVAVSVSASASSSSSSGGAPPECDPPVADSELYGRIARNYASLEQEQVRLCDYRGQVLLIVDVAAL